MSYHMYNNT